VASTVIARSRVVVSHPEDNVVTTLTALPPGECLEIFSDAGPIVVIDEVPVGHKVASRDIERGQPIVKYGETIGIASQPIRAGSHVHRHNCASQRGGA
jgi:altronate dehydratase